jgi:tryptophan synthase alpha chain
MSRISDTFKRLKASGGKGFIAYITAGDPSLVRTGELLDELEKRGVDIVELGIPFSDPIADGPVNQASAQRALKHNVSLRNIFDLVHDFRRRSELPLVFMTYYNPVHRFGMRRFVDTAADAGVDGALITDLPPEEGEEYMDLMQSKGLNTIFLVTPTTRDDRMQLLTDCSSGFVYCVSRTGVTGERTRVSDALRPMVERIRTHTDKPIAIGFGVSLPEQAGEVASIADAVIVGSAINRRIADANGSPDLVTRVGDFVESLVLPVKGAGST